MLWTEEEKEVNGRRNEGISPQTAKASETNEKQGR